MGSIPGLGRSAGEGTGYPLQYSGLENSNGLYIVHGVAKSGTWLSDLHYTTVTLTCDCFALSHQVWEGWMWSRVPQPWVYRKESTLHCGVISPPSQTMCSGSIWTPGAASSVCFTFLQGQSRMEDWTPWQSLQNATAHCMFPLHRPQTQALTSVLCSVVLPKHLQPVLKPSTGLSPSSSHSHTVTPLPGICTV